MRETPGLYLAVSSVLGLCLVREDLLNLWSGPAMGVCTWRTGNLPGDKFILSENLVLPQGMAPFENCHQRRGEILKVT